MEYSMTNKGFTEGWVSQTNWFKRCCLLWTSTSHFGTKSTIQTVSLPENCWNWWFRQWQISSRKNHVWFFLLLLLLLRLHWKLEFKKMDAFLQSWSTISTLVPIPVLFKRTARTRLAVCSITAPCQESFCCRSKITLS